jgi:hypothetical protein
VNGFSRIHFILHSQCAQQTLHVRVRGVSMHEREEGVELRETVL